jgi:hypothetical protein
MLMKKLLVLVSALVMLMMMAAPAMAADSGPDAAFWYGYNNNGHYNDQRTANQFCYNWFGPDYVKRHYGEFQGIGPSFWHEYCYVS